MDESIVPISKLNKFINVEELFVMTTTIPPVSELNKLYDQKKVYNTIGTLIIDAAKHGERGIVTKLVISKEIAFELIEKGYMLDSITGGDITHIRW